MADTESKESEKKSKIVSKTADIIQEERNLSKEISRLLKEQGVEYEEHTESIGRSVKELTKSEVILAKIKNKTNDIQSLEMGMFDLAKDKEQTNRRILKNLEDIVNKESIIKGLEEDMARKGKKKRTTRRPRNGAGVTPAPSAPMTDKDKLKSYKDELIALAALSVEEKIRAASIDDQIKKSGMMIKSEYDQLDVLKRKDMLMKAASGIVAVTLSFYKKLWDVFVAIDNEMFSLRTHFGIFRKDSENAEGLSKLINKNFAGLGVTIEIAAGAIKSIGDDFGLLSSNTQSISEDVSLFTSQLGVSQKNSSGLLKTLSSISGKTLKEAAAGMMGFTADLSSASGTKLDEVMSDIAHASDSVRSTFKGNTIELVKATVEARRMGMSLESMGKSAESLLDFHSSVNSEMEASILLGKNINLMEARRLSFVGDLKGANLEILRVVKSAGEFDKMNASQRKALSAAVGKSVEELQTMLQRDKEISWVREHGTVEMKAQLALQEKLQSSTQSEAEDLGKSYMARVKSEANQARMVELTNKFNELILKLGDDLLPIINDTWKSISENYLPSISNFLKEHTFLMKTLVAVATLFSAAFSAATFIASLSFIGSTFSACIPLIMKVIGFGAEIFEIGAAILELITGISAGVAAVSITLTAVVGYWIGKLIYSISGIGDMIDVTMDYILEKWDMMSDDFVGGIVSVGGDILAALISPFKTFWVWLKGLFIANSPSELGLRIVDGLLSVGNMIFNALSTPFKSVYTFVTDLFNKIPEFILSVFKRGIDFAMNLPGMGMLVKLVDKVTGGPSSTSTNSTEQIKQSATADDTEQKVLAKLTELVDLMKSGGIVINLDGRRVSEFLATASR